MTKSGMNYVYLLRCSDDSLYCGWTNDLDARLKAHNSGREAKYTRSRLPVTLVYHEVYADLHDALSREWHIKRLSNPKKKSCFLAVSNAMNRMDADIRTIAGVFRTKFKHQNL